MLYRPHCFFLFLLVSAASWPCGVSVARRSLLLYQTFLLHFPRYFAWITSRSHKDATWVLRVRASSLFPSQLSSHLLLLLLFLALSLIRCDCNAVLVAFFPPFPLPHRLYAATTAYPSVRPCASRLRYVSTLHPPPPFWGRPGALRSWRHPPSPSPVLCLATVRCRRCPGSPRLLHCHSIRRCVSVHSQHFLCHSLVDRRSCRTICRSLWTFLSTSSFSAPLASSHVRSVVASGPPIAFQIPVVLISAYAICYTCFLPHLLASSLLCMYLALASPFVCQHR